MRNRSARALAVSLAGSAAAALIGSAAARKAPEVYAQLDKPRWAPPTGAFGPVWSVLYLSMGVAAWRIWGSGRGRLPLALHGAQLALNAAWPAAFFAAGRRPLALTVSAALDVAVAAEILTAVREDKAAAALLAPYLGWCLYATALTAAVSDPRRAG